MNRCPNCAALNRDGAKFCTSCGFRLPGDSSGSPSGDRSPFATTSSVPSSDGQDETLDVAANEETVVEVSEPIEWPAADETGPGLSWHSGPPKDTSVPVSDEMIASLVSDDDPAADGDVIELGSPVVVVEDVFEAGVADSEVPASTVPFDASEVDAPSPVGPVTLDGLLRLARELEYGLVELAEAPSSSSQSIETAPTGAIDVRLLTGALEDLQSDDDLAPLRESIATAQERPRDVDVMLDLVLRADSIAALIAERDQLKHAIEIALGSPAADSDEAADDSPDADPEI